MCKTGTKMYNTTEISITRQQFAMYDTHALCVTKITEAFQNSEHVDKRS